MSRMIDLIRVSALPSNVMQSASKGALSVPPREMIEILVYLAVHNKIFGQQAQLTLAGWDETLSKAVDSDPSTSKEVLNYLISPKNLRPVLLPALLTNPTISEESLLELAPVASREAAEVMLKSERVNRSRGILKALLSNPTLTGIQSESIRNKLEPEPAISSAPAAPSEPATEPTPVDQEPEKVATMLDEEFHLTTAEQTQDPAEAPDEGVLAYLSEHAGEIGAEAEQPFQPIGGFYDEFVPGAEEPIAEAATTADGSAAMPAAAAVKKATSKKTRLSPNEERGSALQKISKLDIKGRIQLAMKGTKEERSLLIRDGTKIVALAVLESPKISDGEVERFASQKNVLEAVLRGIPMKRRFAKNYAIIRNLVFNPRTPLDLALGLMKNMLIGDLRNLSNNKEVSDTVRKLATKMFKQKLDTTSKR